MYARGFHWIVLLILLVSIAGKVLDHKNGKGYLQFRDPVFPRLLVKQTTTIAILAELVTVAVLVSPLRMTLKYLAVVWLVMVFGVYRGARHAISPGEGCPCFGSFFSEVLQPQTANNLILTILILLGVATVVGLVKEMKTAKNFEN